jgi:nicotinamidase-related amidase
MPKPMRDALLVVDTITTFEHADGERLLESFRATHTALERALSTARAQAIPVIYVNDSQGRWDSDVSGAIRRALSAPRSGHLMARIAPRPGEPFLRKPRYSAFDHTALELILGDLQVERVLLAGTATEMCIVQTAIDARELGLKVTILTDACASVDAANAALALEYAERVVGVELEAGGVPATLAQP